MSILVLIRHGECLWHSKNTFTGWMDIPLSSDGIIDAIKAGTRISNITLDLVVTSMQIRAVEAAMIALTQCENEKTPMLIRDDETLDDWMASNEKAMEKGIVPVFRNRALNIQCELMDNKDVKIRDSEDKFILPWCFSYDKPLQNDACMNDTAKRTIPFLKNIIIPQLEKGKNVMLSAHNNSLRPIVMFIDEFIKDGSFNFEFPVDRPLCYEFKNGKIEKLDKYPLSGKASSAVF